MPRFIAGHFMHGVMDGVQAELLGFLGQVGLALGGAVLGFHADAQVFLRAGGNDLAQQLREPGGVIRFLERGGLPVFRLQRTVCLQAHYSMRILTQQVTLFGTRLLSLFIL